MEAQFLDHYNRELTYLRELSGEFAKQYPGVAGRLGLESHASADPFVERLLEGFAFLAARVHRKLDAEFPEFTHNLLESIYPHYNRPIPSAAMFCLQPDRDEGSLAGGYCMPKGTVLVGPSSDRLPTACRFDTTEECILWPLRLTDATLVSRDTPDGRPLPNHLINAQTRSCLRISLGTTAGIRSNQLELDRLKLQLLGGATAFRLYDLLGTQAQWAAIRETDDSCKRDPTNHSETWHTLNIEELCSGGFEANARLLPNEPRSFSGYQLLHEYFQLPEKFLNLQFDGLQPALRQFEGKQFEIVLGLAGTDSQLNSQVGRQHFGLFCVPAVNLFRRRADRIQISKRKFEHHLMVDRSRPMDFEIWSIEQLSGHGDTPQEEYEFLPMYAPPPLRQSTAEGASRQRANYYAISRRPRQPSENQLQYGHRSEYLGTELFVSLSTELQSVEVDRVRQLSSTVYCTNRDLALLQPESGWHNAFKLADAGPVAAIECFAGPTRPSPSLSASSGNRLWKLIKPPQPEPPVFCTDARNGSDDRSGASLLKEVLALYCQPHRPSQLRQVDGLLSIRASGVTRQASFPGPILHGRGTAIDLELDDDMFEGGSSFLLASILDQFFARFSSFNSFTQLTLHTKARGQRFQWPVRLGDVAPI